MMIIWSVTNGIGNSVLKKKQKTRKKSFFHYWNRILTTEFRFTCFLYPLICHSFSYNEEMLFKTRKWPFEYFTNLAHQKMVWRPPGLSCLSINFKLILLFSFMFQGCQMILYLTIYNWHFSGNFFQLIKTDLKRRKEKKNKKTSVKTMT